MSYLQSIFLGLVQGLTEFLPVSSSGHLVLFQSLFGFDNASQILFFDVALHLGTLAAVVAVYWKDLLQMTKGLFFKEEVLGRRLVLLVILATIPAVLVGLGFKDQIEALFVSPLCAGIGLLITGTILFTTRFTCHLHKEGTHATLWSAFLVGLAQALAIIPGISRSGSTISAGLSLKLDQTFAARLSFLMAVPAILGSVILTGKDLESIDSSILGPTLVGTLVAAISGFFAIQWLLKLLSQSKLHYFAYYCWAVGLASLLYFHFWL